MKKQYKVYIYDLEFTDVLLSKSPTFKNKRKAEKWFYRNRPKESCSYTIGRVR